MGIVPERSFTRRLGLASKTTPEDRVRYASPGPARKVKRQPVGRHLPKVDQRRHLADTRGDLTGELVLVEVKGDRTAQLSNRVRYGPLERVVEQAAIVVREREVNGRAAAAEEVTHLASRSCAKFPMFDGILPRNCKTK